MFRRTFSASLSSTLALAGCAPSQPPPNCPPATAVAHDDNHHGGHHGKHGARGDHHPGEHHGNHGAQGHHPGGHHGKHGNKGPLVHRFDNAEEWVKRFEGPKRDASQRPQQVVDAMAIVPGARVADIGTGTGYFLPYLSKAVGPTGKVIAADIEPTMVRYVKARAAREKLSNVSPQLVLMDDPLLADGSLDRILIVNTWHHIPDRVSYAKKLQRALASGGVVYIVDFKRDAPHGPPVEHRLEPEKVVQELAQAGLSAARVNTQLLPHQYIVQAGSPLPSAPAASPGG